MAGFQRRSRADGKAYPQWHNAVAGAAAGAGSRFVTAPLDLLRIRRQLDLSRPPPGPFSGAGAPGAAAGAASGPRLDLFSSLARIAREEGGARSLFRGNVAATYLWITYAAIQFSLYSRTSDAISAFAPGAPPRIPAAPPAAAAPSPPRQPLLPEPIRDALGVLGSSPTALAFTSGATAGLCATMATYPFDLCRTTFAAKGLQSGRAGAAAAAAATASVGGGMAPPRSILGFARDIYRTQGIRGFYAGAGPAAVQIVPYMGINFAMYEYFTRTTWERSVMGAGTAGAVAGGTSKFLVYPIDTIKKRLQAQSFIGLPHEQYRGMMDCATTMLREEGFASFYRGLAPTVLKSCSATALTFAFFTLSKNLLEASHDQISNRKEEDQD